MEGLALQNYINVGLLGAGTVGGGVLAVMKDNAEIIEKKIGKKIKITKVFGRDIQKLQEQYGD